MKWISEDIGFRKQVEPGETGIELDKTSTADLGQSVTKDVGGKADDDSVG